MRLSGSFICAGEGPVARSGRWKSANTLRWLGPVPAGWSLAWYGMNCRCGAAAVVLLILSACNTLAEEVDVRNRGRVSLDDFDCSRIESSFIRRICYDEENKYLLVQLGSSWYHYCDVPDAVATGLVEAQSPARYFNANVRARFGCRVDQVPRY
jgi:KTSC domain